VHLLEERRQVFGLRHRDVFAELEEKRVVFFFGDVGLAGSGFEGALHGGEELLLLGDDASTVGVGFEASNGVVGARFGYGGRHGKGTF